MGSAPVSDLNIPEVGGYVAGGGALAKFAWDFITARAKKADQMEADDRAEEAADIKKLLEVTQEIRRDMALFQQTLNTQAGVVAEVKGRLDGISANYGTRLSSLEQSVAGLVTKLELLLERTDRRARK